MGEGLIMTVPIAINSVREQIREAVKLSLGTVCTALNTTDPWNKFNTASAFPLAKAVYDTSTLLAEYIGHRDMRQDTLFVEVAPWCTETNYELATSVVLETYRPLLNTAVVQGYMDASYRDFLGKITLTTAELIGTSLPNPYAVIRFTLTVDYALVS
jgi:hypothetical protein